jgi:hypothetical protein
MGVSGSPEVPLPRVQGPRLGLCSHIPSHGGASIVDAMPISITEYREVGCPACGHTAATLIWLAIDLGERPDLRSDFDQLNSYSGCPACATPILRDVPLLVLGMADEAPLVLACPDDVLLGDDAASSSGAVRARPTPPGPPACPGRGTRAR